MEMKDKTDRLFEALENPARFSDDEIRRMLDDEEMRELYGLMSKTADALIETREPDIDAEWERFTARLPHATKRVGPLPHIIKLFTGRKVAAILTVGVSIAAVAATVAVTYSLVSLKTEKRGQIAAETAVTQPGHIAVEAKDSVDSQIPAGEPLTVIFKNESFGNMISRIADYYGASVKYSNENSKALHLYFQWDQRHPLSEIVEQLNNFEQIDLKLADDTITVK